MTNTDPFTIERNQSRFTGRVYYTARHDDGSMLGANTLSGPLTFGQTFATAYTYDDYDHCVQCAREAVDNYNPPETEEW